MTKKDIMAELDKQGVEYDASSKKEELKALLPVEDSQEDPAKEEPSEETPEEKEEAPKEEKKVAPESKFKAVMLVNVKHDGKYYEAEKEVELGNEKTYQLFQKNGWIKE